MAYCSRCGTQNPEDARFCTKCGAPLAGPRGDLDWHLHQFSQEVEEIGRRIDSSFRGREWRPRHYESWYDRTFGMFVPLIGSFVGLLMLLIVIQVFSSMTGPETWPKDVANFLEKYIGVLFVLMLLGGYVSYFSRRYHPFRWVSPLIGGMVFYLVMWLVSILLSALSVDTSNPTLQTVASQFSVLILPLTLLVIVLGYVGVIASMSHSHPPALPVRQPAPMPVAPAPVAPAAGAPAGRPRRLYRSGRERILGGVCGGIAEYLDVDPVIVRVVFVIGGVLSFGVLVLGYVVLWVLVPRNPEQPW